MKKSKLKKILATFTMILAMSLIMLTPTLSLFSLTSYGVSAGEIEYRINNGYLKFDTYTGMITGGRTDKDTDLVIPSTINGMKVNGIADNALFGSSRSIILSDGITYIGYFELLSRTEYIYIPKSVTEIAPDAFSFNVLGGSISSINVDEENENFCDVDGVLFNKDKSRLLAYPNAREGGYIIPDYVTELDRFAFFNSRHLTSVTIPASVKIIEDHSFGHTNSLETINVDDNNNYFCTVNGILYSKDMTRLISCPGAKSGNCIIPEGVISIADGAFCASNVSSVSLPDSICDIGKYAFYLCYSLKSINIPQNVKRIEKYTFASCNSLETVALPVGLTSIGSYAFYSCDNLNKVVIPDSVTNIESRAFRSDKSLFIYYTGSKNDWGNIEIDEYAFSDNYVLYNNYSCGKLQHFCKIEKYPDCRNVGLKSGTCIICGEQVNQTIPVTGHQLGEWEEAIRPEWFKDGEMRRTCKTCDYHEKEVIPKLNPFNDVEEGKWYTSAVIWCYVNDYMIGMDYNLNHFGLEASDSRALFVTVLAKIHGADVNEYKYSKMSFKDVKPGKWYAGAIEWAYKNGFTAGIGDGLFGYDHDVTLEQIAVFFHTYSKNRGIDVTAETDLSIYSDKDTIHDWALEAVEWAVAEELITGTSETTLSPRAPVTRAQMAVIIKNYIENIIE